MSNGPVVILVRPQLPENIGAVARVMLNFGWTQLRLVEPQCAWPHKAAFACSAGADRVLEEASFYSSIEEAISDLHFVFGTTAEPRHMVKSLYDPASFWSKSFSGSLGILFGPERTGLTRQDLAHVQGVVTIPTNPEFSSLNLAQAVGMMAYEYSRKKAVACLKTGESPLASRGELENFLAYFIKSLETSAFLKNAGIRPHMEINLRNIFTRINCTHQELKTLRGAIESLKKRV